MTDKEALARGIYACQERAKQHPCGNCGDRWKETAECLMRILQDLYRKDKND